MQSLEWNENVIKTTETKKVNDYDSISKACFVNRHRWQKGSEVKEVVKCCVMQRNRFLNYQISQSL